MQGSYLSLRTWLFGLGVLLLQAAPVAEASMFQTLRPGESITLSAPGPQHLQVEIPSAGVYLLETKGDTDTFCRLYDRIRGPFAKDDDSGEAKNCKLQLYLSKGTYKMWVRKKKRAVRVVLSSFQEQGTMEELTAGVPATHKLQLGHYRTFQFDLKKRQWLSLKAQAWTLHHCRLQNKQGWSQPVKIRYYRRSKKYRLRYRRYRRYSYYQHYAPSCQLSGLLEAGRYQLVVYGRKATASTPKRYRTAKLTLQFGAQQLRKMGWQGVRFRPGQTTKTFWFQIPKLPQGQRATLVVEAKQSRRYYYYGWGIRLYRQGWASPSRKQLGYCYGSRYKRICTIAVRARPGQRYVMQVWGRRYHNTKFRYLVFTPPKLLKPNHQIQALNLKGERGRVRFDIAKAGKYHIEVSPSTNSCFVERLNQPIHKRTVAFRGMTLSPGFRFQKTLSLNKSGQTRWIRLRKSGTLRFETKGSYDTYCRLQTAMGQTLGTDDDGGAGRNCRLERVLKPGIYAVFVRLYRSSYNRSTTLYIRFGAGSAAAKKKPGAKNKKSTTGCKFHTTLKPGQYRLHMPEPQTATMRTVTLRDFPLSGKVEKVQQLQVQADTPATFTRPVMPIQISSSRPWKYWSKWFALMSHQSRFLIWKVRRPGVFRFQSLGHLRLSCQIQTRGETLFRSKGGKKYGNCHMAHYLPKGTYRIHIQALGDTEGPAGFHIQRLAQVSLSKLVPGQWRFGRLGAAQVGFTTTTLQAKTPNALLAYSLDSRFHCLIASDKGWPLAITKGCQWRTKPKAEQKVRVWFFSANSQSPVRFLLGVQNQASANALQGLFPKRRSRKGKKRARRPKKSKDPNKSTSIKLNQSYATRLSVLGWDAYTFEVQKDMTVRFELTTKMMGRLFRAQTFVSELKPDGHNKTQTLRLKAGWYRLLIRPKPSHWQARSYRLRTQILSTAPGVDLFVPVPSSIELEVSKRRRIELWTTGFRDVWCSLQTLDGNLIAQNDDASPSRWDCRLSRLLPKGKYRLQIEGVARRGGGVLGGTRLSIRQQKLGKVFDLKHAPKAWTGLASGQIQGYQFQLKAARWLSLGTRSRKGRIACVLERTAPKQSIYGRSEGSRCRLEQLVPAGSYRWRIRSLQKGDNQLQHSFTRKSLPTLQPSQAAKSLAVPAKGSTQLQLQIAQEGRYRLQITGGSFHCAEAKIGRELEGFGCSAMKLWQRGLRVLQLRSKGAKAATASISLRLVPLKPGSVEDIKVAGGRISQFPIAIAKAGVFHLHIAGRDDLRWGCQLGNTQVLTEAAFGQTRRDWLMPLAKGLHLLRCWRPAVPGHRDATFPGKLSLRRLSFLDASQAHKVWRHRTLEGQMKGAKGWKLPAARSFSLIMRGLGVAFIRSAKGRILHACFARGGLSSCDWSHHPGMKGGALWISTGQSRSLRYRIIPRQKQNHISQARLDLGTSLVLPQAQQRGRMTLWLRGAKAAAAQLETVGGSVRCVLFERGPVYKSGCDQSLQVSQKARRFVIDIQRRPSLFLLYPKGHRASALWGRSQPSTGAARAVTLGQWSGLQDAQNKSLMWSLVQLDEAGAFEARTTARSLACVLMSSAKKVLKATASNKGCAFAMPLSKGSYWVGVRDLRGRPLRGSIWLQTRRVIALKKSRQGPYLLGAGESRWFSFALKRGAKIGLGVVGQYDAIRCVLYDQKRAVVGNSCQSYPTLKAGRYWVKVELPKGSKATQLQVKLRGLKPPPNTPPQAYLKQMMRQK